MWLHDMVITFLWKSIENLLIDTFLRKAWKFLNNFSKGTRKVFNGRMRKMAYSCKLLISSNCKIDDILKELLIPYGLYQIPDYHAKCFINIFWLYVYILQLFWSCISYTDIIFHPIRVKINNHKSKPPPSSNILWIKDCPRQFNGMYGMSWFQYKLIQ